MSNLKKTHAIQRNNTDHPLRAVKLVRASPQRQIEKVNNSSSNLHNNSNFFRDHVKNSRREDQENAILEIAHSPLARFKRQHQNSFDKNSSAMKVTKPNGQFNMVPSVSPTPKRIDSLSSREEEGLEGDNWKNRQKNFQIVLKEEMKDSNSENLGSDGISNVDSKDGNSLIQNLEEEFMNQDMPIIKRLGSTGEIKSKVRASSSNSRQCAEKIKKAGVSNQKPSSINMNLEPSKFPKISNKLPKINKRFGNLNLDIEAIEESNKQMFDVQPNQATAKAGIPENSVVNALNALNSLKHIGLEDDASIQNQEDQEDDDFNQHNVEVPIHPILMQNSPKQQLLEQKRLLVGISNIIDNTDSEHHDENQLSDEEEENFQINNDHESDSEGEVPDTQREAHNGFSQTKRKVNMLNTQKYSSFGAQAFLQNKAKGNIFNENRHRNGSEQKRNFPSNQRNGDMHAFLQSQNSTGKIISLNMKTPSNANKSTKKLLFQAPQFRLKSNEKLDQSQNHAGGLENSRSAIHLGRFQLGQTNKSLSTINGENLGLTNKMQIRDSNFNQGAGISMMNQSESNDRLLVLPFNGIQHSMDVQKGIRTKQIKKYEMSNKSNEIVLDVKGKDLKFLTINMLNINLVHVNISKNKISKLPEELCQLQWLESLNVEMNQLTALPKSIGELKRIQELIVSENLIENLPESLGTMKSLKHLHIQSNRLTQIPVSLKNLALESFGFEWFMYFDPPQQQIQKGHQGGYVISQLQEFLSTRITVAPAINDGQPMQKYKSFGEFICFFHICKKLKRQELTRLQIEIYLKEKVRFSVKHRCLVQTMCSNKHIHLLSEILLGSKQKQDQSNQINEIIRKSIDLDIEDRNEQSPFLCALRQSTSEYARVMLDVVVQSQQPGSRLTKSLPNLNKLNSKHGYPLHIAILSHKFEIALRMLRMGPKVVNPMATTQIGANIVHLLFVKYDKDSVLSYQILKECLRLKVDVNHIDDLKASPLHVAIRKRQYQALKDCIQINKEEGKQIFDFNSLDKKGFTPLHFAVEKQDYDMFMTLLDDPFIDTYKQDLNYLKPRVTTVIFSAFHKILYQREKIHMRRKFQNDLVKDYVDYNNVMNKSSGKPKMPNSKIKKGATSPKPVSMSNRLRKDLDLSNRKERYFLKNQLIAQINVIHDNYIEDGVINANTQTLGSEFVDLSYLQALGSDGDPNDMTDYSQPQIQNLYTSNRGNGEKDKSPNRDKEISEWFSSVKDHNQFYEKFEEQNNYVSHQLFSYREMKKHGILGLHNQSPTLPSKQIQQLDVNKLQKHSNQKSIQGTSNRSLHSKNKQGSLKMVQMSPINRSQAIIDRPNQLEFDSGSTTPRIFGRQITTKNAGNRANSIRNQNLRNAANAYGGAVNQLREDQTFGPKMPATTSNGANKIKNMQNLNMDPSDRGNRFKIPSHISVPNIHSTSTNGNTLQTQGHWQHLSPQMSEHLPPNLQSMIGLQQPYFQPQQSTQQQQPTGIPQQPQGLPQSVASSDLQQQPQVIIGSVNINYNNVYIMNGNQIEGPQATGQQPQPTVTGGMQQNVQMQNQVPIHRQTQNLRQGGGLQDPSFQRPASQHHFQLNDPLAAARFQQARNYQKQKHHIKNNVEKLVQNNLKRNTAKLTEDDLNMMYSPVGAAAAEQNSRSMMVGGGLYVHSETQNEEQLYMMEHMMDLAEGDYNNEGIVPQNDASRLAMRSFEWKNELMDSQRAPNKPSQNENNQNQIPRKVPVIGSGDLRQPYIIKQNKIQFSDSGANSSKKKRN